MLQAAGGYTVFGPQGINLYTGAPGTRMNGIVRAVVKVGSYGKAAACSCYTLASRNPEQLLASYSMHVASMLTSY